MNSVTNLFTSSLGRKYIMAISGAALFMFVVVHLLGNLQIFLGPDTINRYAHFLQTNPEILWPARAGLLLLVVLHLWSAASLTIENRKARPVRYEQFEVVAASYASRTMMMSGLIITAFVIYHLLHFTAHNEPINLTGQDFAAFRDELGRHDIYRMMIVGFSNHWVSGFYILSVALLCMHLSHGVSSMFQSVGWKNATYGPLIDRIARIAAWAIFLGYVSIPIAVLLGLGGESLK